MKERLDKLLLERDIVSDYQKARALVMAGMVVVNGKKIDKIGTKVDPGSDIYLKGDKNPYVSRGGLKLDGALNEFQVDLKGKTAMDVGASTGGFTDCLLGRGVKRIYAVDVGYGLLAWKIKQDPRVVNLERRNIRYLDRNEIREEIDLAVIDVSFISLKVVLPKVVYLTGPGAAIIALIKPQFEVKKGEVGEGGVVREENKRKRVIAEIIRFSEEIGLEPLGISQSVLTGPKGNREFFVYLKKKESELENRK